MITSCAVTAYQLKFNFSDHSEIAHFYLLIIGKTMEFDLKRSISSLLKICLIIFAGLVLTIIVNAFLLHSTKANRQKLSIMPVVTDVENQPTVDFKQVEKPVAQTVVAGSLEGFLPPVNPDAPDPPMSKKSNTEIENLLFAMKFYAQVPQDEELTVSVAGWDVETGYYLPDSNMLGSPIYAIARNIRYLLILKLYQEYFPTTKFFDDDALRVSAIVDKMIDPQQIDQLITSDAFFKEQVPDKIFYDLMWLNDLTGEQKYKDAAINIGLKYSNLVSIQANLVKGNRDRTDRVFMFGYSALGYAVGKQLGNIDLIRDSEFLMNELISQLWSEKFGLLFTDASIGSLGNVTTTFITNDQMHALVGMIRYADASGDKKVEDIATKILQSLADGSNPLCDTSRLGFFRRYNGESRSAHKDYKLADDHISYLEAWVKLNVANDGKYDTSLSNEYENYTTILYDSYANSIYYSYNLDFTPYPYYKNRPCASVDAILDFLLLTLEDRKFRTENKLG